MKKVFVCVFAFCLSASVFAQFAAGVRGSLNFKGLTGQGDYLDYWSSLNPGEKRSYFKTSPISVGAEMFVQYDFQNFGFEVDFGLNNRQGLIGSYENKVESKKTIYYSDLYFDYVTYELSPMFRIFSRSTEDTKFVFAAGPNLVFTKDTTRIGVTDNTINTDKAIQNTFNYGVRLGASMETPIIEHLLLSMGIISTIDFKNAYKDDYNKFYFNNTLKKRLNFHLFYGIGYKF